MIKKLLVITPMAIAIGAMQVQSGAVSLAALSTVQQAYAQKDILAEDNMSLTNRYKVPNVNEVFADNILLTLSRMSGRIVDPKNINWEAVRAEQTHEIILKPGEVFAFHDGVMEQYKDSVVATTASHFNAADGFKSSGYLYGDGVCHLASLFNRAARSAGLKVVSPVNHDFAVIPDVSREYGTSIYYAPGEPNVSEMQNLYIENTLDKTVRIEIISNREDVKVVFAVEK